MGSQEDVANLKRPPPPPMPPNTRYLCEDILSGDKIVITGCYVVTPCCTECDWFSQPLLGFSNGIVMPRIVCPKCGEAVLEMVGRYEIIETKRWFFGIKREYVGFIRKCKEG